MNPELRELYQEVILDHNKRPRNKGRLEHATGSADGYNPLCGDTIHVELEVDHDVVKDIKFDGHGCAISMASASLLTEAVKGKTVAEARELFNSMQDMLTGGEAYFEDDELLALSGVREFPVRIKCAVLAWHALKQALEGGGTATSE